MVETSTTLNTIQYNIVYLQHPYINLKGHVMVVFVFSFLRSFGCHLVRFGQLLR